MLLPSAFCRGRSVIINRFSVQIVGFHHRTIDFLNRPSTSRDTVGYQKNNYLL